VIIKLELLYVAYDYLVEALDHLEHGDETMCVKKINLANALIAFISESL
jgi:hypothetical protein